MKLQDFWLIIKERRKIVKLAFFATVITTLVGSLLLPPKYEGLATIMLDFDSSNPMNISMAVNPQMLTSVEYINTQLEIIKSRRIAEGVVNILNLDKVPDIIADYDKATAGSTLFFWRKKTETDIKTWLADEFLSRYLKVEPARDSRFIYSCGSTSRRKGSSRSRVPCMTTRSRGLTRSAGTWHRPRRSSMRRT